MKYVALLTIVDPELNQRVRPDHLKYISDLYEQGKVVMAGPFTDGKGGMVVYECDSEAQASELANADPVVKAGARTLELRAWQALDLPVR
ncbi:hypothetical protein JI721_08965 [Alicyclobacillus cycloheptanicus]|jgi:uncharacterized protein YciI|uniref:Uncharacterized protein YciI n=1 Tax=Alicyclobacillus cycloheptanicus TaxID=1457 RepID=A0ABT9XIR3_9BACL|nr:YciI family protein [Alicyclobacillus cycloheptanicus]MDQ0189601.1 uncharacterized protein YciI [Alicyclobacillus cycloheptanicus]WDL99911.1 hypothetical protein JI721_08965 [Alicyclobacillus cycloheptanicus]